MPTSIRPFRGVQDNLEDPDEYIEDSSGQMLRTFDPQNLLQSSGQAILHQQDIQNSFSQQSRRKSGRMVFEPGFHGPKRLGYSQGLFSQALQLSFRTLTDQALGEEG